MSLLRTEVAPPKARRLVELLAPEPQREIRLLTLVSSGRTVQAVRTDRGPLREFAPDLHIGGLDRARLQVGAPELERLVSIELDPDGPPLSLLDGLAAGTVRADPAWVPALERVRALPRWARSWLSRLFPAGAYGVALLDLDAALCVRISPAMTRHFGGITALDLNASERAPAPFVGLLRRRFGKPQLAVIASEAAVRAVFASPRPFTELERQEIRGELRIAAASLRVRLACLLLRLLGG